jgi:hypothetical protein
MHGNNTRNSLCSYLYLKLAKIPCSSFHLCFFFYKIREQESGTGSPQEWRGEAGTSGRGKVAGEDLEG